MRVLVLSILFSFSAWSADPLTTTVRNLLNTCQNPTPSVTCEATPGPSDTDYLNANPTREVKGCFRADNEPLPFTELQPGQHRIVVRDNYARKSGPLTGITRSTTSADYMIRRLPNVNGKANYEAVVQVNFTGATNLTAEMLQRTRDCFQREAPYMKGPSGEQLRIRVITPADAANLRGYRNLPKPVDISVTQQDPGYRGNAGMFGTNFTCSTITHEFLHHLGLTDEYHEGVINDTDTGVTADWSCRPVTTGTSIMRAKDLAFDEVVPLTNRCSCDENCEAVMNSTNPNVRKIYLSMEGWSAVANETSLMDKHCFAKTPYDPIAEENLPDRAFTLGEESGNQTVFYSYKVIPASPGKFMAWRQKIQCDCPEGHPYCSRLVNDLKERSRKPIPSVFCPSGTTAVQREPSIGQDGESRVVGTGKDRQLILTTPGTQGESLLRPQHFYKIIAGNCTGAAPSYEACAPYTTMPSGEMCHSMPSFCNDSAIYLDGPPGTPSATRH
jgi:hypothetical protein